MAEVLAARGGRALVFRGDDGLDELTTATTSSVWVVRDGEVEPDRLDPAALGIPASAPDALRGGSPAFNADVFRRVLAGEQGPVRDAVLLNAAAALAAFDDAGRAAARRAGGRHGAGGGRRRRRAGGGAARALGDGQPGRSRLGPVPTRLSRDGRGLSVGGLEADRERGLEVVAGVGAEGDVGLGLEHARAPC